MTTFTEGQHAAEFLVSEAAGTRSRETGTLLSGQDLEAGAVLGKVAKGAASIVAAAGNTGSGSIAAATVGAGAKVGAYRVYCIEPGTNAGVFAVEDPDGIEIGEATVAVAFSTDLTFTIADGTVDFVAGDDFTITVAAGSGKFKEYNPANTDGSETAVAVLYDNVDASLADTSMTYIARDAEAVADSLQWFTGATTNQKTTGKADLALVGIIAR